MLDLKAKLLAAGVVTAAQVEKVEAEEAARRQRAKERRDAEARRRGEGGSDGGSRGPRPERAPREARPGPASVGRPGPASVGRPAPEPRRDRRDEDPDEKRARREHEWNEAQRWRKRLEQLKSAGKSEQYEAIRGWVMKDRVDDKKITEAAVRFHFARTDGSVGHLTVEPDVQQRLTDGSAAVVAFMGYNGIEHAVVPRDVADDVRAVRPDWLRHLAGITDAVPDAVPDVVAGLDDNAARDGQAAAGSSEDAETVPRRDDAPANDDDPPLRDAGTATDEDAAPTPADGA
jgi:uncharacterized protein YaiL (DUF2058 family)